MYDERVAEAIRAVLSSAENGIPASRPDLHGDLPGVPGALGRALRKIHTSPIPDRAAPFDLTQAMTHRLSDGEIVPEELGEPYRRYSAEALVEAWQNAPGRSDEMTCCIGRPTIDRMLLAAGEVSDVEGEFGLVVDPHLDLAVMQHSLHRALGGEAVFGFYEAYDSQPDLLRLDRADLAARLLGWIA